VRPVFPEIRALLLQTWANRKHAYEPMRGVTHETISSTSFMSNSSSTLPRDLPRATWACTCRCQFNRSRRSDCDKLAPQTVRALLS